MYKSNTVYFSMGWNIAMSFKRFTLLLIACLLALGALVPCAPALAKSKSPYRVDVDLVNQIVTVYTNDKDSDIVIQCLCSSGANGATPTGTFTMPEKKRPTERTEWFHFRAFGGYARYATRIYMDVMFHSLLYTRPKESRINEQSVRDFGFPVSHGCIRLRTEDAKFIAENCPVGTVVKIHKKNEKDEELRQLLFQSSYHADSGQSYNSFLGIPDEPGILGKNSSGDEVRDLQLKLRALGIFNEEITGTYSLSTVKAVREAQKLLGVEQTGMATLEFQEAIARPDAPSAMNVPLQHGDSGPAVRALQRNLQTLRLYGGDIDGVYDVDVINGVTTFQNAYGFPDDGVASPLVQQAIYYEAHHIQALFPSQDYAMEVQSRDTYIGTVNCEVGIKLRKEPSTKSESLMSLRNGSTVVCVEYGPKWSKVMKNGEVGYVMNAYMEYTAKASLVLNYTGGDGAAYTLGITDINESPAEKFTDYVEAGGSLEKHADLVEHATATAELELRQTPSDSGELLGSVPSGSEVQLLLKSSEWSLVEYGGVQGYVRNDRVEFWLGPDEEDDEPGSAEVFEDDTTETATVEPHEGKSAPVYESADEASAVLGSLKRGKVVNVIETVEGWSLIELEGHQGYMEERDLNFAVTL